MLYEFYLKHFKHRELLEEKARLESEAETLRRQQDASERRSIAEAIEQFRYRESPLFQVVFITLFGWTTSLMGMASIGMIRANRKGWQMSLIMEPVVKPFLKTAIIAPLLSFTASVAFVNYNHKYRSAYWAAIKKDE